MVRGADYWSWCCGGLSGPILLVWGSVVGSVRVFIGPVDYSLVETHGEKGMVWNIRGVVFSVVCGGG